MPLAVFPSRYHEDYLAFIKTCLDTQFLYDHAIDYTPSSFSNSIKKDYKQVIHIAFSGIAASTLFNNNLFGKNTNTIPRAFEDLLKKISWFNDNKIYVKIQFLFPYIYSDFIYTLIEAEESIGYQKISDNPFDLNFSKLENLGKDDITASPIYTAQKDSLKAINTLVKNYHLQISPEGDCINPIQVRFTTIGLNICCFIINNLFFSDPILAIKEKNNKNRLSIRQLVGLSTWYTLFKHLSINSHKLIDLPGHLKTNDPTLQACQFPEAIMLAKNQIVSRSKLESPLVASAVLL